MGLSFRKRTKGKTTHTNFSLSSKGAHVSQSFKLGGLAINVSPNRKGMASYNFGNGIRYHFTNPKKSKSKKFNPTTYEPIRITSSPRDKAKNRLAEIEIELLRIKNAIMENTSNDEEILSVLALMRETETLERFLVELDRKPEKDYFGWIGTFLGDIKDLSLWLLKWAFYITVTITTIFAFWVFLIWLTNK